MPRKTRCLQNLIASLTLGVQSLVFAADRTDVFDLDIDELEHVPISAASRLLHGAEKQPASITIISRQQIEASGARTLSDVIALYTPGYFKTEDQDDVIAGFRGLSPDNNSKVLFLIDGKAVNTEWFWGAPDAILNGHDLNWIERIEIVRGPGSALLGQGALLGVINVISTSSNARANSVTVGSSYGQNGQRTLSVKWGVDSTRGFIDGYLSALNYHGEQMENEGWVHDRLSDNGTVFSLNHHLQRAKANQQSIRFRSNEWTLSYREIQQRRDLYNFYRERDEVEQTLTVLDANYQNTFETPLQYSFDWQHNIDDYNLYSHNDVDMGGVRETRDTFQTVIHPAVNEEFFQWLVGAEYRSTHSGLSNAQGDNYIINDPSGLSSHVNETNTYVYDSHIDIASLFAETSIAINTKNDFYLGARMDDHPKWGKRVTPRASWFYTVSPDDHLRVSYQRGFRGAVGVHYSGGFRGDGLLSESNFDLVSNNAVLHGLGFNDINATRPEEMRGWEINYSATANYHWRWSLTGFQNTIRNIIDVGVIYVDPAIVDITGQSIGSDRAGTWNGFFYFKNTPGEIKNRGFEAELVYDNGPAHVTLSQAYIEARHANAEQTTGSMYLVSGGNDLHFKAYPENVFRLACRYDIKANWKLQYAHVQAQSWWSPAGEKQKQIAWGNATLEWQPNLSWRWQLSVNNLWNQTALYPINNNADDALLSQSGTPSLSGREVKLTVQFIQ